MPRRSARSFCSFDVAEAARVYLERTNASVETVNRAAEIRSLAERQMGEFLKVMPKNQGALPGKTGSKSEPVLDPTPTLAEIGISKKQSATAQKPGYRISRVAAGPRSVGGSPLLPFRSLKTSLEVKERPHGEPFSPAPQE